MLKANLGGGDMKINFLSSKNRAVVLGVAMVGMSFGSITNAYNHTKSGDPGSITAVDLIGQWVGAGAPNSDFTYTDVSGKQYQASFDKDILTLFTKSGKWHKNQQSCASCHFSNGENSFHEMDLSSYEGLMRGGDVLSKPPGVPLFGETAIGDTNYDWEHSKLKARMRDNRMPPGWTFDITEANRDGPCVDMSASGAQVVTEGHGLKYGCDNNALGLIGAWVGAGAPEHKEFAYGGGVADFDRDVLPFFTKAGTWFPNSQSCGSCHFGNIESSFHEMDLTSYKGLMRGGDVISKPPGVPLFGESVIGAKDYDWGHSKMKGRLRNNRMPPGISFDITEANRDGPLINPAH